MKEISIPLATQTRAETSVNQRVSASSSNLERVPTILVVDDTDFVLRVVASILKTAEFQVLQASSGPEAIELAANFDGQIDILLSDVKMPGMSGPEMCATLKADRPELRVMLMSGFSGGDLVVLHHGWAFIEKPFVPAKLVEMIRLVLQASDPSQITHQYEMLPA